MTVGNFRHYVDVCFYDGGRFHRTVTPDNQSNANLKAAPIGAGVNAGTGDTALPDDSVAIEAIQGGVNPACQAELGPLIPLERTSETGLRHGDGAISMARLTPDSAVADFFICIGEWPELDDGGRRDPDGRGFAAFGHVTSGKDVVEAIQASPADGQALDPPIVITRITRLA